VLGLVTVAVPLMAAFVLVELRTTQPLVDLRQLSARTVLLVCAVWFMGGFGSFVFLLIPLVVHASVSAGHRLADSVAVSGFYLVPLGLAAALSAPLAGRFERRIGTRAVMLMGTGAVVVANTILFGAEHPLLIFVSTAVAGFGIGVGLTQAMNIVAVTVAAEHTAAVSGVAVVIRVVGGALGAQIGASILAAGATGAPTWTDFRAALVVSTLVGMVAVGLSWAIPTKTTAARLPETRNVHCTNARE
jgi:MFS family permease